MQITIEQYENIRPVAAVNVNGRAVAYAVPNKMAHWRVETLFTKEPATVQWLDRLKPGMVLLDVGANVGMYTILSSAVKGATVFAFEPESQNFALLAKNVVLNKVQDKVTPFCAALSDEIKLDKLYLSEFKWDGGSSCHSFGEEVGFDLKPRQSPFAQGCVSYTIDEAIRQGVMPVPDFIKIDVDGFEHKVIGGARQTLLDPKVRSLCIEINPNLPQHQQVIRELAALGFHYDQRQVELVTRKEGAFEGCAEFIFDRVGVDELKVEQAFVRTPLPSLSQQTERAFEHVIHKIESCDVTTNPFPFVVLDDIFPDDYYQRMLDMFPVDAELTPLSETGRTTGDAYKQRLVSLFNDEHFDKLGAERRAFWSEYASWMYSERFISSVVRKFLPWCANRLAGLKEKAGQIRVRSDGLLVSDRTDYAIGPHTDASHRLITFLFYMPQDDRYRALGTSLFKHKDPAFFCPGGPHYPFDNFEKFSTVEFLPNRLLTFVRTGRSFHGVEQITVPEVDRRLLINNVRLLDVGAGQ